MDSRDLEENDDSLTLNDVSQNTDSDTLVDLKQNSLVKKNNKNKKWILIIIILCLLIAIGGVLIAIFYHRQSNDDITLTKEEQKEIIEDYGVTLEGLLNVYLKEKDLLLSYEDLILLVKYNHKIECSEHEIYENAKIYLNDCSIDRVDVEYSYGEKQVEPKVELKEGDIKVYVSKTTQKATLEKPNDIDQYDVIDFDLNERYSNLTLLSDTSDYIIYFDNQNKGQIYNFRKKEKGLSHVEYQYIYPIKNNGVYDDEYVAVSLGDINNERSYKNSNDSYYQAYTFYHLKTGTRVSDNLYYNLNNNSDNRHAKILFALESVDDGKIFAMRKDNYVLLNYRTGEEIISCDRYISSKDGYVVASGEYQSLYDLSGKRILEDKSILSFVSKDAILILDNENVQIVNILGEIQGDFGKLGNNKFHYSIPKHKGVFFYFDNPVVDRENIDETCISLYYEFATKKIIKKNTHCGAVDFISE